MVRSHRNNLQSRLHLHPSFTSFSALSLYFKPSEQTNAEAQCEVLNVAVRKLA